MAIITLNPCGEISDRPLAGQVLMHLLCKAQNGCNSSSKMLDGFLRSIRHGGRIKVTQQFAETAQIAQPWARTFDCVLSTMERNGR